MGIRGVQLVKKDFGLEMDMAKRVGTKPILGEAGMKVYEDLDSRIERRTDDDVCWEVDEGWLGVTRLKRA